MKNIFNLQKVSIISTLTVVVAITAEGLSYWSSNNSLYNLIKIIVYKK